ncbi:MAG: ParB N-terminal domain-containing protein [Planctomycetota bacterium]
MSEVEWIDPHDLAPLHDVPESPFLRGMVEDMIADGWQGRPLLAFSTDTPAEPFVAWTGSHRIAAAREAGLSAIPCVVLDAGVLAAAGVTPRHGHVDDTERLAVLEQVCADGDAALALMRAENRC